MGANRFEQVKRLKRFPEVSDWPYFQRSRQQV
jgi:hypothetical protein